MKRRRALGRGAALETEARLEIVMATNDNERVTRGSGDFLKDMGYDNPDEMRVKFALANSIALTIEDLGLNHL
jgi:hypothetical protein